MIGHQAFLPRRLDRFGVVRDDPELIAALGAVIGLVQSAA
jgi:hypothetical protein